jgi:hypothetical protein
MVGDKTTQTKIKNLDHTAKKNGVGLKGTCGRVVIYISTDIFQLSRGEICVANFIPP